jgi:membrane dipeptidase
MNPGRAGDARTSGAVMVDGLVFRGDGWNELVARSGLAALHVTAADFLADFAAVREQTAEWHARFEQDERLFHVAGPGDLARIGRTPGRTGVILGLQNGEALGRSLERLSTLAELGIRVLQLTYNEGNQLADGCLEPRDAGLTRLGREVVRECNRLGIAVDLSHVGRRSTIEAANVSDAPVLVTHANRSALAPSARNKTDDELRAVIATGGVVGVSPYGPMCWDGNGRPTAASFVEQVTSMLELFGEDAVAIGSDYSAVASAGAVDGVLARSQLLYPEIFAAYVEAFGDDLSSRYCEGLETLGHWSHVPELLAGAGLSRQTLAAVLGGNWIRIYDAIWSARA